MPLESGDLTGATERRFVMSTEGIGSFAGGRIFRNQVPDGYTLPRDATGGIRPYAVATFNPPFPSANGRAIAGGFKSYPHIMPFMIVSYADNIDYAEALDSGIRLKLIDLAPSLTASPIQSSGGYIPPKDDTGSRPTRFAVGSWFRVILNLAGT